MPSWIKPWTGWDLTSEFADGCSNGLNHWQNIGLSQHHMKSFQQIKTQTDFCIMCPHGIKPWTGWELTSKLADGCSNGLNHWQNIGLSQHPVKRFQQIKTQTDFCIMCPHGIKPWTGWELTSKLADGCSNGLNHWQITGLCLVHVKEFSSFPNQQRFGLIWLSVHQNSHKS